MGSSVHTDNEQVLYVEESVDTILLMLEQSTLRPSTKSVLKLHQRFGQGPIAIWAGRIRFVTETR